MRNGSEKFSNLYETLSWQMLSWDSKIYLTVVSLMLTNTPFCSTGHSSSGVCPRGLVCSILRRKLRRRSDLGAECPYKLSTSLLSLHFPMTWGALHPRRTSFPTLPADRYTHVHIDRHTPANPLMGSTKPIFIPANCPLHLSPVPAETRQPENSLSPL